MPMRLPPTTALVAIPEADRTFGQTMFLKAYTNVGFVESEGSFGLHNWDYSRAIVNTALNQAKAAEANPPEPRKWVVSLRVSKSTINKGQKVFFRGAVLDGWGFTGKGKITLQRRMSGQSWRNWKTQTLASNGTYDIQQRLNFAKGKWYLPCQHARRWRTQSRRRQPQQDSQNQVVQPSGFWPTGLSDDRRHAKGGPREGAALRASGAGPGRPRVAPAPRPGGRPAAFDRPDG